MNNKGLLWIKDPDPDPGPGDSKRPDPTGSGSATLVYTELVYTWGRDYS